MSTEVNGKTITQVNIVAIEGNKELPKEQKPGKQGKEFKNK